MSTIRKQESGTPPGEQSQERFWRLWPMHQDYLFKLSLRWMRGNRAEAEDALSRAKVNGATRYGTSTTIQNERAWLCRLVYNACMDSYRAGERDLELSGHDGEGGSVLAVGSPEQRLLVLELCTQVAEILRELPEPWRRALLERCFLDSSYADIARAAGTTETNVRKRVQLARHFLKSRIRDGQIVKDPDPLATARAEIPPSIRRADRDPSTSSKVSFPGN